MEAPGVPGGGFWRLLGLKLPQTILSFFLFFFSFFDIFQHVLFKKILFFGLPILFVNLFGTLAATMEKLVSSIFLDFESIANVGALTFIGSIFLIISSQLLSLFSQYSREFIVEKPKQTKILFRSYIAFTHFSVVVYILFSAILFSILEKYIIPVFAKS